MMQGVSSEGGQASGLRGGRPCQVGAPGTLRPPAVFRVLGYQGLKGYRVGDLVRVGHQARGGHQPDLLAREVRLRLVNRRPCLFPPGAT